MPTTSRARGRAPGARRSADRATPPRRRGREPADLHAEEPLDRRARWVATGPTRRLARRRDQAAEARGAARVSIPLTIAAPTWGRTSCSARCTEPSARSILDERARCRGAVVVMLLSVADLVWIFVHWRRAAWMRRRQAEYDASLAAAGRSSTSTSSRPTGGRRRHRAEPEPNWVRRPRPARIRTTTTFNPSIGSRRVHPVFRNRGARVPFRIHSVGPGRVNGDGAGA